MKSQHKFFHGKSELIRTQSDLTDPEIIEREVRLRHRLLGMEREQAHPIVKRVLAEQVRLAKIYHAKSWRRSDDY